MIYSVTESIREETIFKRFDYIWVLMVHPNIHALSLIGAVKLNSICEFKLFGGSFLKCVLVETWLDGILTCSSKEFQVLHGPMIEVTQELIHNYI